MGWTKLRVAHGGINALNADFSLVVPAIPWHPGKDQYRLKKREKVRLRTTVSNKHLEYGGEAMACNCEQLGGPGNTCVWTLNRQRIRG